MSAGAGGDGPYRAQDERVTQIRVTDILKPSSKTPNDQKSESGNASFQMKENGMG